MSWRECHIGYYLVGIFFGVFGFALSSVGLFLAGVIAWMNGVYAVAFSSRADGAYSPFVWWLALIATAIQLVLFTALEIAARAEAAMLLEVLAICLAIKLMFGQFLFLMRVRRKGMQEFAAAILPNSDPQN
jgi:hypothetical protein